MTEKLMKIISFVLHPLLMPTYSFGVLFLFIPEVIMPLTIVTLPFLFITTFIIPLLSVSMLKITGSISSFKLENRVERLTPFSFVTIFYGITSYMFIYKIQVNDAVATMLLTTTLLILLTTIITTKFKISIHAAGISGVVGFLVYFGIFFPSNQITALLIIGITLSGLVMSSRLYLQAHSIKEVAAGACLGITVAFSGLFFFG
jgi:membrane-associated phospholipid phosphatase